MTRCKLCVFVVPAIVISACTHASALRGRLREVRAMIDDAKNNGAMLCAPRELATASSHLQFAEIDLAQGELSNAWEHLAVAQPNAEAAILLSPAARCRRVPGEGPQSGSRPDLGGSL
jgi:hypothetical protein